MLKSLCYMAFTLGINMHFIESDPGLVFKSMYDAYEKWLKSHISWSMMTKALTNIFLKAFHKLRQSFKSQGHIQFYFHEPMNNLGRV